MLTVKPSVSVVTPPTIREGRTATLQVTITSAIPMVANSTSTREWKFSNGSAITSNSRYSFSTDRFALSISVVTLTDSGDYTFQATNAAGSGTANITLTVTSGTTRALLRHIQETKEMFLTYVVIWPKCGKGFFCPLLVCFFFPPILM